MLNSLDPLNQIQISRWAGYSNSENITELAGFRCASGNGYTAVIYSISSIITAKETVTSHLACGDGGGVRGWYNIETPIGKRGTANLYQDVKRNMDDIPIKFVAYADS